MKAKYAVIGASSGTGQALTQLLAQQQQPVHAISRRLATAAPYIIPIAADITQPSNLEKALTGDLKTVFFTVDIHGVFLSRKQVRQTIYQGLVNVIDQLATMETSPRLVVLSPMGPEQPSWVWTMLNTLKPGFQQSILEREQHLQQSGLDYVLCRAPKLTNAAKSTHGIQVVPAHHSLNMARSIARANLAECMLDASMRAESGTAWDIFGSH